MAADPIRFYNRYTQALETEQIFGERWLRFAYENPMGRAGLWLLARRKFFSAYYGWKMSRRRSQLRVLPFIAKYDLNVEEFAKSAFAYRSFNEFFYRTLKPECRPISEGAAVAVLPADGRHLVFPDVDAAAGFYVKGAKFSLVELFADASLAREFSGGAMLISRLCPVDYHRFHFPVSGSPGPARLIKGWLYSVSPIALRRNIGYLVQNKRMLTLMETEAFGRVAMFEVGATNVGSIRQSYVEGRAVARGEEKGLFAFGGSCVITIFQRGRIQFAPDLVAQSAVHIETYARMGDVLGTCTSRST